MHYKTHLHHSSVDCYGPIYIGIYMQVNVIVVEQHLYYHCPSVYYQVFMIIIIIIIFIF